MAKKETTKKEKTFSFDVTKVELKDLDGNCYREKIEEQLDKPLHKDLGNKLYLFNPDFDIMPKAESIHKNTPVTFTAKQAETFKTFVQDQTPYSNFIKYKILEQLVEAK